MARAASDWKIKACRRGLLIVLIGGLASFAAYAQPSISVTATDATAAELGSTGEFTFTLSQAVPNAALSVAIAAAGSATPGNDYTALPQSIEFPAGALTQTLRVSPVIDDIQEGDENVVVNIVAGSGYTVGPSASAIVTIADLQQAAPLPTASIRRDSTDPRESGDDPGFFIVELSEPAGGGGITISLETQGNATAGADYTALPQSVRLNAGERSARIALQVLDDTAPEGAESVTTRLLPGDGYQLASSREATLFILDDDSATGTPGGAPQAGGAPGVVSSIQNTDTRTAATNGTERLTVTVIDGVGSPVSAVAIQWQLDATGTTAGGALSAADAFTNSDGQASVTLSTGALPATYTVGITATGGSGSGTTTVTASVTVLAGLANAAALNTPEGAIAVTLDTICARLNQSGATSDAEQALLARCNELLAAAENGETSAVNDALRRIAPEEVAAQRRVSRQAAERALGDVYSRLHQLRHGARGVQLDNLSFRTSEGTLSGAMLAPLLRGGGAGGDEPLWQTERWGLFLTGNFGQAERDRTANESGYDADTQGLTVGADYRHSDKLIYGAALTYGSTDTQMQDNGGTLDAEGYGLTFYGTYYHNERLYFDSLLGIGDHDFDTVRRIDYTLNSGSFSEQAQGSTQGAQQSFALGVGYEQPLPGAWTVDWTGRAAFVSHDIDGYTESGSQAFNLRIGSQSYESLTLSLGAQIQKAFSTSWGVVLPMVRAAWEHDSKGAHKIGGSFVADSQSTPFSFDSDEWDKDYLRAAVGLSAILRNGTTVFISYDSVLQREHYSESELAFGARWQRNF